MSQRRSSTSTTGHGSQRRSSTSTTHHGSEQGEYDRNERQLRAFDLDMKYGPWSGITRQARYDRAVLDGLNPPPIIGELLRSGKHWTGHPGHAGK